MILIFIFLVLYVFFNHVYSSNTCKIDEYYQKPIENFIASRNLQNKFTCEDDHFIVRDKFYIYVKTSAIEFPMDRNYFLTGVVDNNLCQVNVITGKLDWKSFQKCIYFYVYSIISFAVFITIWL